MNYKFTKESRTQIINIYKTWKQQHPNLNITTAVKKLYLNITARGLCIASDIQLSIWVNKGYIVYRTMDSKWYFGGYYNKDKSAFIIHEVRTCGTMADSAVNQSVPEHNNYHPQNPQLEEHIVLNESKIRSIIRETIRKILLTA